MARLTSIPPFVGTIGPVTVYMMYERYFIRTRSSLTAERVKTDPAFAKTMQYADLLGKASTIASGLYTMAPPHRKSKAFFNAITGEVMTWMKYQWTKHEIVEYLTVRYADCGALEKQYPATSLRANARSQSTRLQDGVAGLVKVKRAKRGSFDLRAWQLHDKKFRREYNRTFHEYAWNKEAIAPG